LRETSHASESLPFARLSAPVKRELALQLATESILLSLAGGICGVVLAYAGLRSLLALAPADLPREDGIAVNSIVPLAIVLLTGAGLLVRSFLLLNSVERGFDTTHLLTVSASLPYEKYKERSRGQAFFDAQFNGSSRSREFPQQHAP
jgi:hypothetical protein